MTVHPLRAALNSLGGKLNRVTVEARQNDPFRVDTPAGHRNGAWLAMHAGSRRLHLRGLHYLLIGKPRPDTGEPYANTEKDWNWLVAYPGKAARWLGYLSWDQVPDRRNDEPLIHEYSKPDRQPKVTAGTKMGLPSVEDLLPAASADFSPEQPFHLVLFGEKASLESELL